MNFDILKTKIDESEVNAVNGRELHEKLKVLKRYADWIKLRINQGGFEKDVDYVNSFSQFGEKPLSGGRPKIEYYLTVDMAKHIAMMERNNKGREVRQYFIDEEKKLRSLERKLLKEYDTKVTYLNNEVVKASKASKNYKRLLNIERRIRPIEDSEERELKVKINGVKSNLGKYKKVFHKELRLYVLYLIESFSRDELSDDELLIDINSKLTRLYEKEYEV